MEALKKTLFIIAMIIVSSLIIHNLYKLWIEPTGSVLDKYNKFETELNQVESLDELIEKYETVQEEIKAYEADTTKPKIANLDHWQTEPYKSKILTEERIREWESKNKEIYKLVFYCLIGIVFLAIGFLLYRKKLKWLGLTFLIMGFTELIYWGTPTYISQPQIYETMIITQLIINLISFIILLAVGWSINIIKPEKTAQNV
ncbi:MAG: hypothetical protein ACEPO8_09460 [Rhodothermaceae bacterium]